MKMNLLGYTYNIYNCGYNTEMTNAQFDAGDPLETPGGLYRGPPSMLINVNRPYNKKMCVHVRYESSAMFNYYEC